MKIVGTNREDVNNKFGEVIEYLPDSERFLVAPTDRGDKKWALKAKNLHRVSREARCGALQVIYMGACCRSHLSVHCS